MHDSPQILREMTMTKDTHASPFFLFRLVTLNRLDNSNMRQILMLVNMMSVIMLIWIQFFKNTSSLHEQISLIGCSSIIEQCLGRIFISNSIVIQSWRRKMRQTVSVVRHCSSVHCACISEWTNGITWKALEGIWESFLSCRGISLRCWTRTEMLFAVIQDDFLSV